MISFRIQHRLAFVHVPLRSRTCPASDQRPHRICEPGRQTRVPTLPDTMHKCSRESVACADGIRDLYFEAGNLAILAVMKYSTAALPKGDADHFAPILFAPAPAELFHRRRLYSGIDRSVKGLRLAIVELHHGRLHRELFHYRRAPVAVA